MKSEYHSKLTVCNAHYTLLQTTHYIVYTAPYKHNTPYATLYTITHTLHIIHHTAYSIHGTLYTVNYTLVTTIYTIHHNKLTGRRQATTN